MAGLFYQAVLDYNERNKGHPQYELWLNYALSTNQRGQYTVDKLLRLSFSLKGKRLLDIGSGYGGTCIAAAQAGANSTGIEIDSKLLELADLNKQDNPHLPTTFYQMDVLDWDQVKTLGKFELITCDNVIEHVAVPEQLITNISLLLRKGGLAYITIPNAFSINQVRSDCHYGLFGISLLDPWDAAVYLEHALGESSYDVSVYYHLEQYIGFFEKYDLEPLLINALPTGKDSVAGLQAQVDKLKKDFSAILGTGQVPESIVPKLKKVFTLYICQIESGIFYYEKLSKGRAKKRFARQLEREFIEEVWYVAAYNGIRMRLPYYGRKIFDRGRRIIKPFIRKAERRLYGKP
jgi:2-polyprenyl-3-methyl-5-hydroxy-6-metoxy-1,4-benzoquinol methylase